jgi:hypothetical protein
VRNKKKTQHGGQKKKTAKKKMCMCHQMGGRLLTPAQMKMLTRPVRKFKTLPVKRKQRGMGHGCCQCGGNIFDDIGGALTGVFHDPLRAAAAIGTLGASEVIAVPADLFKRTTGVKASKVLDKAALALGSKLTSKGLSMVGLGSRRRIVRQPILV